MCVLISCAFCLFDVVVVFLFVLCVAVFLCVCLCLICFVAFVYLCWFNLESCETYMVGQQTP